MIFVYKHPPLSTKHAHVYDLEGALSFGYTHPHYQLMPNDYESPSVCFYTAWKAKASAKEVST